MSLTPFLDEDRMARPNGHKKVSLDGDGRHRRCRWTLTTDQHAAVVSWHLQKVTVRTDLAGEAQYSAWTQHGCLPRNGANDHEQPRSVPFRSVPQGRIGLRLALRVIGGRVFTPSKEHENFELANRNVICHLSWY